MSYEYTFHLASQSADKVIAKLQSSSFFAYKNEFCIALKDPDILSDWNYDVRVFKENDKKLLFELTNKSLRLYELVKLSLSHIKYTLTELDDSEELILESIF